MLKWEAQMHNSVTLLNNKIKNRSQSPQRQNEQAGRVRGSRIARDEGRKMRGGLR